MSFLSPAFLAALPLVAIPVVLHLLNRRQQKRVSWGAMRFLIAAATRRRRIWTLTDLLLLLLRIAAFALLIFALSRPLMPSTWLGGSLPRDVLLVIDTSLSTQRRTGQQSAFSALIDRAKSLIDELTPNDLVRVILAGESPEWLSEDPLPANATTRRRLQSQFDALKPTTGASDLLAAVREAADLEIPKDKAQRVILVLTDRQKQGWRLDQRPLWESVQRRLRQAAVTTTVSLEFPALEFPTANLSVDRLDTTRPYGGTGQALAFTATISNYGPSDSAPALLSWTVDGAPAGVATVPPLTSGASTTLNLTHVFGKTGTLEVRCRVDIADALAADNEAGVWIDIYDQLPVLFVDEPGPDDDPERDQSFFLAALGLSKSGTDPGWKSVFLPTVVSPAALSGTDLTAYRAIVLADLRTLPAPAVEALERFVQKGGGLWLTLGPRTQPETFAQAFFRGGSGLSPYALGSPVGDPGQRDLFT
ncbi:MAG: BatA domain-containing protein, partial [Verrucomicrobiales bacterium]|nr:BatA domain-containing protein [Verrucomicrobiales bacterium]